MYAHTRTPTYVRSEGVVYVWGTDTATWVYMHTYMRTYIHVYTHADADGCDPRGVRRVRAGRDRGAGEARHAGWPLQAHGLQQGRLSCVCLGGKMYVCMCVCIC